MGRHLIYGGNGGIGSAIARRLVGAGHEVVLAGRNRQELEALAGELNSAFVECDVTDPDAIERAANEAGDSLDGLVYAVGTINLKPFARLTETTFSPTFG